MAGRNITPLNETSKQKEGEEKKEWEEKGGGNELVQVEVEMGEEEKGTRKRGREEAVSTFKELTSQQKGTGQFKSNKLVNAKQCNREQVNNNESKSRGHDRVGWI